jgi:hypothetical protein
MRIDQFDPVLLQPQPRRVAVGRLVVDQPSWLHPRTARARSRNSYLLERRLDERDFRRGRWGNTNSCRYTPAVCHHHELCTLSAFGFADVGVHCFAGENVPSLNVSSDDRMRSSSNSRKHFLQRSSQTPASSHSCSRRKHVAGDGYSAGRSSHRAALRSTHRMPSKQRRSSTRFRPPFLEGFRFGVSGSIFDHCSSVSSDAWRLVERLLSISLVVASPCRA